MRRDPSPFPRSVLGASPWLAAALLACTPKADSQSEPQANGAPSATSAPATPAPSEMSEVEARVDDEAEAVEKLDETPENTDPVPYSGPLLGALYFQTPIYSEIEWPPRDGDTTAKSKSKRIGYIRQGGKVPVKPEPIRKSNCEAGWYELVDGGFVCGKYATIDMNHPKLRHAPHAPYMDRPLPYDYGYNVSNGTPLYSSVPSREERLANEPWLQPKRPREESPDLERAALSGSDSEGLDAGASSNGTPWYLRNHDGGKPKVTLDDLRGDGSGPLIKRMVRGFFLSLDKPFNSGGGRWYRTTQSAIAPADRVMAWKPPTDYFGLWSEDATPAFYAEVSVGTPPVLLKDKNIDAPKQGENGLYGFVLSTKGRQYKVSEDEKNVEPGAALPRHSRAPLTGRSATIKGSRYDETTLGYWLKASEGTRTKPGTRPANVGPEEKWIDINVSTQTLVAFVGDRAVFGTVVSTGRTSSDKTQDHPTPTGSWRVREKHIAATMDGDGAGDGPYSIEDVPWIMYYQGSYATHTAFWHADFGRKKSHGCTNMSPIDAKALFDWAEPKLPRGWHAVWSTEKSPGTMVVVHD